MPTRHRQRVTGQLTASVSDFWSRFHIDILPAVGTNIARKCSVPSSLLKEKWTGKIGDSKKNELKNEH